jgi:HAD superfamily hydrolase (TIGR01509 family)
MGARAAFFDFGGTLCHSRADVLPIFQEAARRAGADVPWDEYLRANEECWGQLWPQAPQLVGSRPAFADRVHEMALQSIGFDGPTELFVQYIREEATSARWHQPFPEVETTLGRLRGAGTPLHIISGHVDYLPAIIANLGWSDLFDTVTFTQEVGVQKPDPRVFRFALSRAGLDPADSVYVGDSWEADYLGARNVGMPAVWLNRAGAPAPGPCREIRTLEDLDRSLTDPSS